MSLIPPFQSLQVQGTRAEQQPQTFLVRAGVRPAEGRALQSQPSHGQQRRRRRDAGARGGAPARHGRSPGPGQGKSPTSGPAGETDFTKLLLAGNSRRLPVLHHEMERKICSGLKRCFYVSSQANECQGGFKLASSQGLVLVLKGSPEAQCPNSCTLRLICRVHTNLSPSAGFLSLASSW